MGDALRPALAGDADTPALSGPWATGGLVPAGRWRVAPAIKLRYVPIACLPFSDEALWANKG